jgi:hypothetical protein
MAAPRVRKILLPSGAQASSAQIRNLVADLDDCTDLHPIYQRDIRWTKEKMNALIGTIMQTGVVPALLLYKLQPGDERKSASYEWECIDGQHRLFVLMHFFRGRAVRLDGREWMISWEWTDEEGQDTHVFYEETEDTKRWIAAHPSVRHDYMTKEEKTAFATFKMEIKEIKDALTLEQRCAIFTSLQQGVQVRGADLLKNFTGVRLVQFIQYEKKWEAAFKHALLVRCWLKAKNYWLHWAIRCFFIVNPVGEDDAADSFKIRDSKIGEMIKKNDPRLATAPLQETAFAEVMERFLAFLDILPAGVKFSPPKFFALFSHLSTAEEGRESLLRGHMAGWAADLASKDLKTAWENRKAGGEDDEREYLFAEAECELDRIKIPAEEMSPRKSIPKKIRGRVWVSAFGAAEVGTCDCCGEEISAEAWECGHVLAAASGGKDTPDNLRPVCRTCNRSMGTMHMDEFKSRYYPEGAASGGETDEE